MRYSEKKILKTGVYRSSRSICCIFFSVGAWAPTQSPQVKTWDSSLAVLTQLGPTFSDHFFWLLLINLHPFWFVCLLHQRSQIQSLLCCQSALTLFHFLKPFNNIAVYRMKSRHHPSIGPSTLLALLSATERFMLSSSNTDAPAWHPVSYYWCFTHV